MCHCRKRASDHQRPSVTLSPVPWVDALRLDFANGVSSITVSQATTLAGQSFAVHLDSTTGPVVATVTAPKVANWYAWNDVTVPAGGGRHARRFPDILRVRQRPLFLVREIMSFTPPIFSSALLDQVIGSARGTLAVRGASVWQAITPGTSGYVLTSGGSGADLAWAAGAGGSPGGSSDDIQVNASNAFVGGGRGTLDSSGNLATTGKGSFGNNSLTGPGLVVSAAASNSVPIFESAMRHRLFGFYLSFPRNPRVQIGSETNDGLQFFSNNLTRLVITASGNTLRLARPLRRTMTEFRLCKCRYGSHQCH